MYAAQSQASPLPPLALESEPVAATSSSFDTAVYEGAATTIPSGRLFEAKSVNLVRRPKSGLGVFRSSCGLTSATALAQAPHVSSTSPHDRPRQPAPRHDKDMAKMRRSLLADSSYVVNNSENSGDGGCGFDETADSRPAVVRRRPSAPTALPGEPLTSSVMNSAFSSLLNTVIPGSSESMMMQHEKYRGSSCGTKGSPVSASPAGSGTAGSGTARSSTDSGLEMGNGSTICNSLRRPSTIHSLRRAHSDFVGPSGLGSSNNNITTARSVLISRNPEVLKGEIRRLQATLMSGFKGGNRFVGGAQFKSSIRKTAGGCGGCLQVREALRRSRAETRDLRGDLFQAETMIKNLTRNKSKRRVRAAKASSSGRGCGELESECEERRMSTSLIAGDENDSISPADRMVESFTGGLVNRVRQREWDSRLVNEAAQRSRNGGGQQGVTAAGTRRGILVEIEGRIDTGEEAANPKPAAVQELLTDDNDGIQKCMRCLERMELVKQEDTKMEEGIGRNCDHQLELKRLREVLTETKAEHSQTKEERRELGERVRHEEQVQAQERERLEREKSLAEIEIERLVQELDNWREGALRHGGQVRRLFDQQEAIRSEASVTTNRLEQTERELEDARAALTLERSLRKREKENAWKIERELAEGKKNCASISKEAATEKELRRRSEAQAVVTEAAHRSALRAALNSCVRLCVVAPTVNINLEDRRHSFCSGLPEEKIRAFVEASVLPRFTRVLLHPGTDTDAPLSSSVSMAVASNNMVRDSNLTGNSARGIGGEDAAGRGGVGHGENGRAGFDKWLREMLLDMQTSIERHVARVFESQTTAQTVNTAVVAASAVGGVSIRR